MHWSKEPEVVIGAVGFNVHYTLTHCGKIVISLGDFYTVWLGTRSN